MRAIIHVGMPKTGSSSIQDTFFAAETPGFRYLPWRHANHGSLTSLFFEKAPEKHNIYAVEPNPTAVVKQLRQQWGPKLKAAFETDPQPNVIISAERLSNVDRTIQEHERLRNYLARYCDSFRVIGYIRPPASYLESAFQQWIKTGKKTETGSHGDFWRAHLSWPDYRRKFEPLDTVFGRDNVELAKFSRETLHRGDVVLDFACRIGAVLAPEDIVRSNERLNLEAVALLYVYRRFGQQCKKGSRADRNLVQTLSRIGSARFIFSNDLIAPILSRHAADLNWIETRLGTGLCEAPRTVSRTIGAEDDLIAVALENAGEVRQLLKGMGASVSGGAGTAPLARLTEDLDRLLDQMALHPAAESRLAGTGDAVGMKENPA